MDPITLIVVALVVTLILSAIGLALYFFWPKENPSHDNLPLHARLSGAPQGAPTHTRTTTNAPHFVSSGENVPRRPRPTPTEGSFEPVISSPTPFPDPRSNVSPLQAPAAPELEPTAPPLTNQERFSENPDVVFIEQFNHIQALYDDNIDKLRRIDERFKSRMHKNTSADIQNHLRAKDLIDALRRRRDLMASILEGTSDRGQTYEDAFEIAFGKMEIGGDKFDSLTLDTGPSEPLGIEEIEAELVRILIEFQRRKTFLDAIKRDVLWPGKN